MNKQITTKSAALGAGLLLFAAVGATVAFNSSAASGAVPQAKANLRAAAVASGKASIFMKVPGIKGTSTIKGLEGWVPLTSLGSGFTMPTSQGQVTGRVSAQNFSFEKAVDLNTPQFLTALTTAKDLSPVEIKVFQTDATGAPRVVTDYMFTHVQITSDTFAQSASAQVEKLQLIYQTIKVTQTLPGKTSGNNFNYSNVPLG
jgi:type VI secretion system Hcp family effector